VQIAFVSLDWNPGCFHAGCMLLLLLLLTMMIHS
jgi:hypothetical protein